MQVLNGAEMQNDFILHFKRSYVIADLLNEYRRKINCGSINDVGVLDVILWIKAIKTDNAPFWSRARCNSKRKRNCRCAARCAHFNDITVVTVGHCVIN